MKQVKKNIAIAMEWIENTERQILPNEDEAWELVVQIEDAKQRLTARQKENAHGHLEMDSREAAISAITKELANLNRQLSELGQDKQGPAERRAKRLAMFEEKGGEKKRGALAELARELNVDRSNLGHELEKARRERAENHRAGAFLAATNQLVKDGKRQH